MQFRVGPWIYRVIITSGPIVCDGDVLVGQCLWESREIRISGAIPVTRRLDVLLHELRHAFVHHFGKPSNDEDDCNSASSFATLAMRELLRQGGEQALMRLLPDGSEAPPSPETWDLPAAVREVQCGVCESMFAPGSVLNGKPRYDETHRHLLMHRGVYCEHCNHVQEWEEGATSGGQPNGHIVSGPVYRKGVVVEAFLAEMQAKQRRSADLISHR